MVNKKYCKRIKKYKCPMCNANLIVCNHGNDWWMTCSEDRNHIQQVLYTSPEEVINFVIEMYSE